MVQILLLQDSYNIIIIADFSQASFAPLNIEIESESEDEVDDSKEIQVLSTA